MEASEAESLVGKTEAQLRSQLEALDSKFEAEVEALKREYTRKRRTLVEQLEAIVGDE